jgi:hypothetical protein
MHQTDTSCLTTAHPNYDIAGTQLAFEISMAQRAASAMHSGFGRRQWSTSTPALALHGPRIAVARHAFRIPSPSFRGLVGRAWARARAQGGGGQEGVRKEEKGHGRADI